MSTSELRYRNDEFEINGAIISSDIELTLTVKSEFGQRYLDLYMGELFQPGEDRGTALDPWLHNAMRVWVARNQSRLIQELWDCERGMRPVLAMRPNRTAVAPVVSEAAE